MLHYNMPPFATGETGRMGSPKRVARSATAAGQARRWSPPCRRKSSRTPCAWSRRSPSPTVPRRWRLGLRRLPGADGRRRADEGAVAGIAMGLIKEGNRFAVLTDILGDEDHLGDMDFKVAGTTKA